MNVRAFGSVEYERGVIWNQQTKSDYFIKICWEKRVVTQGKMLTPYFSLFIQTNFTYVNHFNLIITKVKHGVFKISWN